MYTDDIMNLVSSIDDSIQTVDLSKEVFSKYDGNYSIEGLGDFSPRAFRNLGRWASIPTSLLTTISEDVINKVIQEQFIRKSLSSFRVGFHTPEGASKPNIIFLQPVQEPYLSYNELVEPIRSKIFKVSGNPIFDDYLTFLTKDQEVSPDGDNIIIGQRLKISSTNIRPSSSDLMLYRIICQNGLVSARYSQTYKINTKNASPKFLANLIQARSEDCIDFAKNMVGFVDEAIKREIKEPFEVVMDHAEENASIPRRVIKEARVLGERVNNNEENLSSVGIPTFTNLWMYVNLFTFVCQKFQQPEVVEAAQRGAYAWGYSVLNNTFI